MVTQKSSEDENQRALFAEIELQKALESLAFWQNEADYWQSRFIEIQSIDPELCSCVSAYV